MDEQRSERVADLFHQAVDLPADQRAAFLAEHCGADGALRAAVDELLLHDTPETAGDTFRSPVAAQREQFGDTAAPTHIGPYRIVATLGEGGMGVVYRGEQLRPVKRSVAIKVIKLGMDTREVIARFDAERQAVAMMDHPNIARVYEAGATDAGRPYFVMELVRGTPVTRYCDDKTLSTQDRLKLYIKVCDAVQHAHMKGVIHRDLKPGNILVAEVDGRPEPKVIDFGIVKATTHPLTERTLYTETGQMLGTPEYMSPEQTRPGPEDIDTRSDVYSLGAVLYELLSGAQPFDATSLRSGGYQEIQRIIREVDPPRPSTRITAHLAKRDEIAARRQETVASLSGRLRRELEWIPLMAMRKERDQRYRTAAELADDVRAYLDGRPLVAAPQSRTYRAKKFLRRNRRAVAASAAMAALLVAGVIATGIQAIRATRAERFANQEKALAEQRFDDVRALARGMLFDVQKEVAKLAGSQRAMQEIVDLSRRYLEKLQAERSTDVALIIDVADAYGKLGDIQGRPNSISFDNAPASKKSWEKALELANRAVQLAPNNHRVLASAAIAEVALGDAERLAGNIDGAAQRFERGLELYEAAASAEPGNARYKHNIIVTQVRVASVPFQKSRTTEAISLLSDAIVQARALVQAVPEELDFKSTLASTLQRLASYRTRVGDREGAAKDWHEAIALLESLLTDDLNNAQHQNQLADSYIAAARNANEQGDREAEDRYLSRAIELGRKLTAADGTSRHLQSMLAIALLADAEFKLARNEVDPAGESITEAIAILEKSLAANENDTYVRSMLSVCYGVLGQQLDARGNHDEAVVAISKAADLIRAQADREPNNMRLKAGLVFYERLTANALAKAGRLDEAVITLRRALEAHERIVAAAPDDIVNRRDRLHTQHRLGELIVEVSKRGQIDRARVQSLRAEATVLLIAARDGYAQLLKSTKPLPADAKKLQELNGQISELEGPATNPH